MKYKHSLWALALSALAFCSCSQERVDGPDDNTQTGMVNVRGISVDDSQKEINDSRAVYPINDFIVDFYAEGQTRPAATYVYADMPGTVELPVGTYTVKVRSHDVKGAEWDRPYFAGQSEVFAITANHVTEVEPVKCVFASLKVSVVFGERLGKLLGDDAKVTVTANNSSLEYAPGETRGGFFAAVDGSTTLVAEFSGSVKGKLQTARRTYTDVTAGQHRIITFELGNDLPEPDRTGHANVNGLRIDVTCVDIPINAPVNPGGEETIDPGKKPGLGGDDTPDTPGADEITFTGNLSDGAVYNHTDFNAARPAKINIACTAGCSDVVVTIDSDVLTPSELENVGLAGKFALVADTHLSEALSGLGLPCGDQVKNSKSIDFDITAFMELLGVLGTSTNKFTLDVTDNAGNVKSITFTIKVA